MESVARETNQVPLPTLGRGSRAAGGADQCQSLHWPHLHTEASVHTRPVCVWGLGRLASTTSTHFPKNESFGEPEEYVGTSRKATTAHLNSMETETLVPGTSPHLALSGSFKTSYCWRTGVNFFHTEACHPRQPESMTRHHSHTQLRTWLLVLGQGHSFLAQDKLSLVPRTVFCIFPKICEPLYQMQHKDMIVNWLTSSQNRGKITPAYVWSLKRGPGSGEGC